MRKPSVETQLRNANSELRRLRSYAQGVEAMERRLLERAARAEKAAKDWEARFDALLQRTPAAPRGDEEGR